MKRGEKSMTGRAAVLLQSSQWACCWTVGGNWRKQQVWREQITSQTGAGMRAWTSKAIGLSSWFVHRKSPFAPFSSKTWRRNRSAERRRCVLTNQRSSTHSPTSQDSQECGKPRPGCCLWGVALVRWWAVPAFLVQTVSYVQPGSSGLLLQVDGLGLLWSG